MTTHTPSSTGCQRVEVGMTDNYTTFVKNTLVRNTCKQENFKAGRLKAFKSNWTGLTSDPVILGVIEGFQIPFTTIPKQDRPPKEVSFSNHEKLHVKSEIMRLLKTGVLVTCSREPGDFISNIFLRPKKNGGYRMILNLKKLNEFVPYQHFKMESLQHAIHMMTNNCFMCNIDLLEAYYCVSIHKDHHKYLKFSFENEYYKYTVFPNGLSCCPRIFTKLLKPVFARLRLDGHESVQYIDDCYIKGFTYKQCQQNVLQTVQLLEEMGFIIHPEKSQLNPVQEITFLGFVLNSHDMTVRLPPEKINKLQTACCDLIALCRPTIQQVAEVIGLLISALPGVHCGKLYLNHLQMDKNRALKLCKGNYSAQMTLSQHSLDELQWWYKYGIHSPHKVLQNPPSVIIETDASQKGWGGVISESHKTVNGPWSVDERDLHINCLELKAILFTLKSLCNDCNDSHIRVFTDNTCAVSYITNFGGCRSMECNKVAKDIWLWALHKNNWITIAHLPGKANISADYQSRNVNPDCEWKLNPDIFSQVKIKLSFSPNIDLFASRLNYQLQPYVSFKSDPQSMAIDAFSMITWAKWKFYAFPPFAVIHLVLKKIIQDRASGIIIVPNWPTQSWYPTLCKLLICPPYCLRRSRDLLLSTTAQQETHPLHKKLDLLACLVSGEHLQNH